VVYSDVWYLPRRIQMNLQEGWKKKWKTETC